MKRLKKFEIKDINAGSSSVLNPDGFLAYPCDSYDKFQENGCFPCPAGGCPKMEH